MPRALGPLAGPYICPGGLCSIRIITLLYYYILTRPTQNLVVLNKVGAPQLFCATEQGGAARGPCNKDAVRPLNGDQMSKG
jgi:hypothetical protein